MRNILTYLRSFYKRPEYKLGAIALLIIVYLILAVAPNREYPAVFSLPRGIGLMQTADLLKEKNFIRHKTLFVACAALFGGENRIKAGIYSFERSYTPCAIAWRVKVGEYGHKAMRITVKEGESIFDIANKFENFPNFNAEAFVENAPEGFMFPDTYFVFPDITDDEVASIMQEHFKKRLVSFAEEIEASKRSLMEIITMASIIEKEAVTPEDRRLISGILWRRLDMGMALQVDAAFSYVNGKNTYQLSREDLQIDSPYNTYRFAGLPPTPIGNPGIDSIEAALKPTESPYWYFLSDLSGQVYYAVNFDGHQDNRERYLRR